MSIALGSANELDAQIVISMEIGFITKEKQEELTMKLAEISKILYKLSHQ